MSNMFYKKINYISWRNEAKRIVLTNDEMVAMIKGIRSTRTVAKSNTKRSDFINGDTYKLDKKGNYVSLYLCIDGEYYVYTNNVMSDAHKTSINRPDRLFETRFKEFNNITLRMAFGFTGANLKRCIPKQLYYINESYCNKVVKASSIDASSQYPSGCLGTLPDVHGAIRLSGRYKPSKEYPFAFYASGHLAIYNELDTHEWLAHKLAPNLFRLNKTDTWPLRPLKDEEEETILMPASQYTMDKTWNYFYNIKRNFSNEEEYNEAKLVMNQTIGDWHRKDKDKKSIMTYEDHGSYQLAHIVAVAIARGNQKILNKLDEISPNSLLPIMHICVDGIIYLGDEKHGIDEAEFGKFRQEFQNCDFMMSGINVYCARQNGHCVKFKHGGYDLLDDQPIDESKDFEFEDLHKLSQKERVGDIYNG